MSAGAEMVHKEKEEVDEATKLPALQQDNTTFESIQAVRAAGLDVDNNNKPAPENIPTNDGTNNNISNSPSLWG